MTEPENLTLVFLRRMDEKLDRLIDDVRDPKVRMTDLEERVGKLDVTVSGVNRRIDRVEARLDRIERRLDLVEIPH